MHDFSYYLLCAYGMGDDPSGFLAAVLYRVNDCVCGTGRHSDSEAQEDEKMSGAECLPGGGERKGVIALQKKLSVAVCDTGPVLP